jgi:hypothetical protein
LVVTQVVRISGRSELEGPLYVVRWQRVKTQNTDNRICEYRWNYRAGSNLVKEKTGDLLEDYHTIVDIIVHLLNVRKWN